MPEVKMSLAELDKLRDDLKEKDEIINRRQEEIVELKSKAREVIITEEIKYIPQDIAFDIDYHSLGNLIRNVGNQVVSGYSKVYNPSYNKMIEGEIRRFIKINHNHSPTRSDEKKTRYKNLDDVKLAIRKELELEYSNELVSLRSQVKSIREEEQAKSLEIQKNLNLYIKGLSEQNAHWAQKYDELEQGKKQDSLLEQLTKDRAKWRDRYIRLIRKPWYKRIFYNEKDSIKEDK